MNTYRLIAALSTPGHPKSRQQDISFQPKFRETIVTNITNKYLSFELAKKKIWSN
jgi:hypothetical protein